MTESKHVCILRFNAMRKSIVIITFLSIASFATAANSKDLSLFAAREDPAFEQKMQNQVAVFIRELVQQGPSIGDLDFTTLTREIEQVHWLRSSQGFFAGSGEPRASSIYLVEERTVVFNDLTLAYTSDWVLPLVALHESLGALGYIDENYEITLSLYFSAHHAMGSSEKILLPYVTNLKRRKSNPVYAGSKTFGLFAKKGGSTSVGGGGDASSLEIKIECIKRIGEWLQKNPAHQQAADFFAARTIETRLEPSAQLFAATSVWRDKASEPSRDSALYRFSNVDWINARLRGEATKSEFIMAALNLIFSEVKSP